MHAHHRLGTRLSPTYRLCSCTSSFTSDATRGSLPSCRAGPAAVQRLVRLQHPGSGQLLLWQLTCLHGSSTRQSLTLTLKSSQTAWQYNVAHAPCDCEFLAAPWKLAGPCAHRSHLAGLLGSEQQKQELLPRLAKLEWTGAWALTEPSNGSDASALQTTAKEVLPD